MGQTLTKTELIPLGAERLKGAHWYAVMTNPRCEARAQMDLASAGYRAFFPRVKRWITHARVRTTVERPLLSRYVFVEVDYPRQSFGGVKAANGVELVVSNGGLPCVVPASFVEGFMLRYLQGEFDETRGDPLVVGTRVRIVEGEFDDWMATVVHQRRGRMTVKLVGTNRYHRLHHSSVRAA